MLFNSWPFILFFLSLFSSRRTANVAGIVLAAATVAVEGEAEREFIYFQF